MPFLFVLLLSALSWSCHGRDAFEGDVYEAALQKPRLPLAILVKARVPELQPGGSGALGGQADVPATSDGSGEMAPAGVPALAARPQELQEFVREALERYDAAAVVRVDDGAGNGGFEPDVELELIVRHPGRSKVQSKDLHSWRWVPNAFLWFLAGVPSWFIEDVDVDQGLEVDFEVHRLPRQATDTPLMEEDVTIGTDTTLNFIQRAEWPDYLWQILMPPFVLPFVPFAGLREDKVDEALYGRYVAEIQADIGRVVKDKVQRSFALSGIPLLVVRQSDAGGIHLSVFGREDRPSTILVESVASGGVRTKLYDGLLADVDPPLLNPSQFRETFGALLGENAELLKIYDYQLELAKTAGEMPGYRPASGEVLRVTVTSQGGRRGAREDKWTVRY